MKTRAAVALEAGKPLEIMDVNLDGPRAGEVLVEIKATGICHTDDSPCQVLILRGFSQRSWATKVLALCWKWGKA